MQAFCPMSFPMNKVAMAHDALLSDRRADSAKTGIACPGHRAESRHCWQIAALSKDIRRKPVGITIREHPLVLFRGEDGTIAALEDRCVHRNAPLSIGRICGNRLQCAYHGWEYDRDGDVANVPALPEFESRPALRSASFPAIEQQGFVWIALVNEAPAAAPLPFPHFRESGWTSFVMNTRFQATVEACLENFLDCPHATFVHRYWFRSPTARLVKAIVRTLDDGASAEFFEEPREKSAVWSLLAPRGGDMHHTDRFIAPATSRVDYRFPNGLHYIITSSCTEISARETEVFTVISFKFRGCGPLVRLYFEPLSRFIIRQDVRILAAQQANGARFGSPQFASTKADLLGPLISAWRKALSEGTPPPPAGTERQIDIRF